MSGHTLHAEAQHRVVKTLPFVEALARRMAASMPHSIDIGDLVQDGVLGLIDAAQRFGSIRGAASSSKRLPSAAFVGR